jgi:hypothetical protein
MVKFGSIPGIFKSEFVNIILYISLSFLKISLFLTELLFKIWSNSLKLFLKSIELTWGFVSRLNGCSTAINSLSILPSSSSIQLLDFKVNR